MTDPTKTDYRDTLNITLNDKDPGAFPQRGNLPEKEPKTLARWAEADIYRKSVERPAPKGPFVLHDGPPYSNGNIHLGHALNKVSKDIVTRFRTMQGYCSPYVPGWDNHGMPIENAVSKKFREEKRGADRVELRKACRVYAAEWVEIQRNQFKRLGIRGLWDDPYLTMSSEFEAKIVEVFGELALKGFVYRGLKPVMWCGTCETALADAEVEYENHTSNSIYVRFPLWSDTKQVFAGLEEGVPCFVVIWTTTPWTMPANLAVAVHPEADYAVVLAKKESESAYYLVASALVEATMRAAGYEDFTTVRTISGQELEGEIFKHPLFDRTSPVVLADYVTMDSGTGVVHTAPGHGKEDFDTGKKYGMEVLNPVGPDARYTVQAGEYDGVKFQGLRVTTYGQSKQDAEANVALIKALETSGNLLNASKYDHSYPHCWRCHTPLIFRATVQWFIDIDHDGFRQKALKAIEDVAWFPKESVNRITSMVTNRPDWCVSRQRSWGVGIPAFYCDTCGEHILTAESIGAVVELARKEGSDSWYERSAIEILPQGFVCPHCSASADKLRKETDVLDVWFDSGSTHRAVLENSAHWKNMTLPAAVYLEGGDQHRGWFMSSLMIGVGTKGAAPFHSVLTNGWTLDEKGKAMHKSLGNVINPLEVIEKSGADVLRLWVASQNFMEDTSLGENILKQVSEMYRRIRNTFRFLVNNLYDFDPAQNAVPVSELLELDRWALERLNLAVAASEASYNRYEFHKVYQTVLNFATVELSSFYLDVLKDRLYASGKDSVERRSAQTVMSVIAETLARLLAPMLPFTTEEVWDFLKIVNKPESVHLAAFPVGAESDEALLQRWSPLLEARDLVKKAIEEARQEKVIGNPLEACIELPVSMAGLQSFGDQLPSLLIVSQVKFGSGDSVVVSPASGVKCSRCWLIKTDLGTNPEHPELCLRCTKAVLEA